MDTTESPSSSRPWYAPSVPDVFFAVSALIIFSWSGQGMMDDPGLGWHLRIADQMWELRGFVSEEVFCLETEGRRWVAYAWLGDVLLRLCYEWAGLNGIGALTSLTLALCFRSLVTRMNSEQVPWLVAISWSYLAVMATKAFWLARPNVFTFAGLALTVTICDRFHRGQISRACTLWLLPLFMFWANVHSGFLSGALVLAITYLVECYLSVAGRTPELRSASRRRALWWTGLGCALFAATLINPYGLALYEWLFYVVTDPYIQQSSTMEWLPTDFTAPGFALAEGLLLTLLLLFAVSRGKVSLLAVALCVIWLHFALGSKRYVALWVIIAVPTVAALCCGTRWYELALQWLRRHTSARFQARFSHRPGRTPFAASVIFSIAFLASSRWLGTVARHHPDNMPTAALNHLLQSYQGERVFHSANWGGYLIWNGWDLQPRFRAWIDDRIDVHGKEHTEEYYRLMNAEQGWQDTLDTRRIEVLCLPVDKPLATQASQRPDWREDYRDAKTVIFRRSR